MAKTKPLTQQQLEDLQVLKKAIEKMLNGNKKK